MKDWKEMMDSVPLAECEKEFERQLESISGHDNRMKRAVLLCLLVGKVLAEIEKEDAGAFVRELEERLTVLQQEHQSRRLSLLEHVTENASVLKHLDVLPDELQELSAQVSRLLDKYDGILGNVVRERDELPLGKLCQKPS